MRQSVEPKKNRSAAIRNAGPALIDAPSRGRKRLERSPALAVFDIPENLGATASYLADGVSVLSVV